MNVLILSFLIVTISFCALTQFIEPEEIISQECLEKIKPDLESSEQKIMQKNIEYNALFEGFQDALSRDDKNKSAELIKSMDGKWKCCLMLYVHDILKTSIEKHCNKADIDNFNKGLSDTEEAVKHYCSGISLIDLKCNNDN